MDSEHDVFISYCRDDVALMETIQACLREADLSIWVDEKLTLGSIWPDEISRAIKRTGCLVVILTPCVPESEWVKEELAFAKAHEKPVYPILASGDEKSSVPFGYMSSNWIDIRSEEPCGPNMQKLASTIKKNVNRDTNEIEYFQPLVKMTGKWRLDYSGAGFVGKGIYHFDEPNTFKATVFNPIFSEDEIQSGMWKIENNELIIQGITSLRGQSMPFRATVKIIKADIGVDSIEASVTTNGYEILGKLTRI